MSFVPCPMSNWSLSLRFQQPERLPKLISRKDGRSILPKMAANKFAQHSAEVCGDFKIPPLEQLFGFQSGPRTVDFSTSHRTAQNKHGVAMAVVCSVIPVFRCGTAEFGHRHDHDVFHTIAHVARKGGQ